MVGGTTFLLCKGAKYLDASLKDSNKNWVEEWFVEANPAPGLPPRTGYHPVLNNKWEEMPTKRRCSR